MTMQPAPIELAELACKTRPDWERRAVDGAIAAARNAGWSWRRTLLEIAQMMADDEAAPRDLLTAVRHPLERYSAQPMPDEVRAELLEPARQSIAEASAVLRQRERDTSEEGDAA